MVDPAGAYLFFLGVASGLALLTLTAYRYVSPLWLRWLLRLVGLFVLSRYVAMALFTAEDAVHRVWSLRYCWFATSVGVTLPSVIAIDQLLRHPALSPKKLLIWFSPFLLVYAVVILFARMTPAPDPVIGWIPRLQLGWQLLLAAVQTIFVLGFVGICGVVIRKVPVAAVRSALSLLAVSHLYLGFDGLLLALGRWYFRPFLFSEMLALVSIWHAYETSVRLHGR